MFGRRVLLMVAALATVACGAPAPGGVVLRSPPRTDGGPASSVPAPTLTTGREEAPIRSGSAPPPGPAGPAALVTATGVVVPIASGRPGAWVVTTPCGTRRALASGTAVRQATVVLDPGHGGGDPGAVSPGGLAEAPVNLEVARRAKAVLDAQGVPTLLTRTADYEMTLRSRAMVATALSPRAFVSIHHNAEPDGPRSGPGTETYYQQKSADSKRLAGLIYEEVVKALSAHEIRWEADTDAGAKYRPGSKGDYYAMLRLPAPVTSVLAELAFVSNPPEAALLARADVQAAEGDAVARGILRYLRTSDPGSGFTTPYPRPDPPPGPGGPGSACRDPQL